MIYCLGCGFISLESKHSSGRYVGVQEDGDCKISEEMSDETMFSVIPVEPVSYIYLS